MQQPGNVVPQSIIVTPPGYRGVRLFPNVTQQDIGKIGSYAVSVNGTDMAMKFDKYAYYLFSNKSKSLSAKPVVTSTFFNQCQNAAGCDEGFCCATVNIGFVPPADILNYKNKTAAPFSIKRCMKGGKLRADLFSTYRVEKISDPATCPFDAPPAVPGGMRQILNWFLGGTKLTAAATLAVATSLAALAA